METNTEGTNSICPWCKTVVAFVSTVTTVWVWLCSGGLCVCVNAVVVWTLSWLPPSSSEAEASPTARPGPTVGNGLCVIVRAINCWWRICLCACSNNGNIKYLARIIIIHFLATAEIWLIVRKLKISKEAVKRLYFVDMMTICLHTPFMVNITSDLCAPGKGSALYMRAGAHSFGKIIMSWEWLEIR